MKSYSIARRGSKYRMRLHEILTEAITQFTTADFAKAAQDSEYGLVTLTMSGDGHLHLGDKWHARGDKTDPQYHPDVSWRRSIKLSLIPARKQLEVRQGSRGEALLPKVQQALRRLRDMGIIDASWQIKTAMEASGRDQDSHFVKYPNPVDQKGLDALADKAIRLSPVTQNMTLYHGTSTLDWQRIQKIGLVPLGHGPNSVHGYESRAKHAGNQKVLYLAGSMDKAQDYAKLRVESLNRIKGRVSADALHDIQPVVLAVRVPDPARLVADDDTVNQMARGIASTLWKAKPVEQQQQIMQALSRQRGFDVKDPTVGEMLWRETDAGFAEIMARLPPKIFKVWKASLVRDNQVGYRGIIPPKFLTRIL